MKIDLLSFTIPNFVRMASKPGNRGDGFKESPAFPLADVPAEDLAALCDQFRSDVFQKASKTDPATAGRCTCSDCGREVNNAWRDSDGHHCLTCLAKQRDDARDQVAEHH